MPASPEIVFRRAVASDLPAINALLHRYYNEQDILLRDDPEKTAFDLAHPEFGFFLAEIDATPAGCLLFCPLPTILFAAEYKRLYVAPEYRGHGLAGRLMDAAEAQARNIGLQ